MSEAAVLAAFPRRPLTPAGRKLSQGMILALLFTVGLLGGGLFEGYRLWQDISIKQALRTRGVPADVLSSEGKCFKRRQVIEAQPERCTLTLVYKTRPEHGTQERTGKSFITDPGIMVFNSPPALYDPQNPDHVMFEKEVKRDRGWKENIHIPVLLIVSMGMLALTILALRSGPERFGRHPQPTFYPVDRIDRIAGNMLNYSFMLPGSMTPASRAFRDEERPMLSEDPPGNYRVLALLDAKGHPLLLRGDFSEFNFTEEEKGAIRAAAHAS